MIKTMSLGLGLLKVCLSVSLNRVSTRLDQVKHAIPLFCRKVSNVAQANKHVGLSVLLLM